MKSIRSHTRPRRGLAVAGLLVLTGMMATGCGDDDDPSDPTQVGDVITPVVVDVTTLAGTTVDVVVGGIVDVNVPDDSDVAAWTATVDDEEVVAFVAGRDDGGATFNPGFQALAEGTSAVTLSDPAGGTTVEFTIDVQPG